MTCTLGVLLVFLRLPIIQDMNCPTCNKPMRKVRWEITNNFKAGKDFTEYDKNTYECKDDDVWVNIETPMPKKQTKKDS